MNDKNSAIKANQKLWTAKEETPKQPTHICTHNLIIVDESGSMQRIYSAALRGMNSTLETIRKAAVDYPNQEQIVTLIAFDSEHYKQKYLRTPAAETTALTAADYQPGSCTPLYDAMGKAINDLLPHVGEEDGVLVTIITDGLENASTEYTRAEIKKLVDFLSEKGWLFTYIGANQDSESVGASMGIENTLDFKHDHEGTEKMFMRESCSRADYYSKRNVMSKAEVAKIKDYFKK